MSAAQIAYRGAVALDASDITKVRLLVDMALNPGGQA